MLIHYEKLTAKRAAKHQQLSADHANGTRSAVERQQLEADIGSVGMSDCPIDEAIAAALES